VTKAKLIGTAASLLVRDVAAAAQYYCEKLGFTAQHPVGDGSFCSVQPYADCRARSQWWHRCREFGVQDVDGYDISFGQMIRGS
jgi:catechol-2,3-dioxygenase